MDQSQKQMIKLYLDNLQVNVNVVEYTQVNRNWEDFDYKPDYNKFYLIMDGEGLIKIDGREYYPGPGHLVLMPEGVRQSYATISDHCYTKYWCHFTARIGSLNLFDRIRVPWVLPVHEDEAPVRFFQNMLRHKEAGSLAASLQIKSEILQLIAYYLNRSANHNLGIVQSDNIETLRSIILYIDEHFRENLTIHDLAEISHFHPNYFIRLFKKHFGSTPIQYINRKRMEDCKRLLISTDLMLADIGERIGIHDVSYLSRIFKKETGFSPSNYREFNRNRK